MKVRLICRQKIDGGTHIGKLKKSGEEGIMHEFWEIAPTFTHKGFFAPEGELTIMKSK